MLLHRPNSSPVHRSKRGDPPVRQPPPFGGVPGWQTRPWRGSCPSPRSKLVSSPRITSAPASPAWQTPARSGPAGSIQGSPGRDRPARGGRRIGASRQPDSSPPFRRAARPVAEPGGGSRRLPLDRRSVRRAGPSRPQAGDQAAVAADRIGGRWCAPINRDIASRQPPYSFANRQGRIFVHAPPYACPKHFINKYKLPRRGRLTPRLSCAIKPSTSRRAGWSFESNRAAQFAVARRAWIAMPKRRRRFGVRYRSRSDRERRGSAGGVSYRGGFYRAGRADVSASPGADHALGTSGAHYCLPSGNARGRFARESALMPGSAGTAPTMWLLRRRRAEARASPR